jgi:UDP-glucose:glycoprotein glucosyltransferase
LDEAHGEISGSGYVRAANRHSGNANSTSSTGDVPFDRMFGNASTALGSVLYADITSPQFAQFHRTLSESAKEGKTSYRLRYKPSPRIGRPLTVHGYGVELALKKTDYIVIDDRDKSDDDEKDLPKAEQPGDSMLQSEEEVADLKPLSTSELAGLGIRAAGFIMSSDDPLETFLKLSQDFPKHSGRISAHNASEEFIKEWTGNSAYAIPQGYNIIWINGVQIDPREMNPFSLLEHIRRERKLINAFRQLGLSGLEAINLLSHDDVSTAHADEEPQRYDFRDDTDGGNVIMWLNDISKDKRYEDWPTSIQAVGSIWEFLIEFILTLSS